MRRLFISISAILFLFSCSPHLFVSQITTKNIQVNTHTSFSDSVVQSVLTPYRDSIENDMSKVVAISSAPLKKEKPESKLTNFVADILLEYGNEYCKVNQLNQKPDASYVNYGGLRASLPQGEITVGHIFELMPFENEVVLIKISGEAIRKMADRIAARGGEGVAGLIIGIRNEKTGTLKIGGKALDPDASYWLVTSDYLANGGDQMNMLSDPVERINTGRKMRDLLIKAISDRFKKEGILSITEDGRIYNEQ